MEISGQSRGPLNGKTVLLVDDEKVIRNVFARFLERKGAKTIQAKNGEEALDILHQTPVDLVITDQIMGTGFMKGSDLAQAVNRLRAEGKQTNVKVILCCGDVNTTITDPIIDGCPRYGYEDAYFHGYSEPKKRKTAPEPGVHATLIKPVSAEQIVAAVIKALANETEVNESFELVGVGVRSSRGR